MKFAVRINESINRIDRMINDLLDVNIVKVGQLIPLHKTKNCDMSSIVQDVCTELITIHGERIHFVSKTPCSVHNKTSAFFQTFSPTPRLIIISSNSSSSSNTISRFFITARFFS